MPTREELKKRGFTDADIAANPNLLNDPPKLDPVIDMDEEFKDRLENDAAHDGPEIEGGEDTFIDYDEIEDEEA